MLPKSLTSPAPWADAPSTARLVLADGTVIAGQGLGATGSAVGEVCFNTAMTGYQEILTDPSYAGQIITFTFPHIGNVGVNQEDTETSNLAARSGVRGCVLRAVITDPSNYRSSQNLDQWLKSRGIIAIAGVDTRALTALIREKGMPNGVIAHDPSGQFDIDKLKAEAAAWPGLDGMDLVPEVTSGQSYTWDETRWVWNVGYGRQEKPEFHVVAIDYGLKRNILRCLASAGCKVTVVPAQTQADDILERKPDGVFLSNGPGDPAATGRYAVPEIKKLVDSGLPVFGICLGHQMLALALGAKTRKMHQGHHGANHPGEGLHHRQGGDHLHEPRLHRRPRDAAGRRRGDARVAVRRVELRPAGEGQAGVLGAVPPRGLARPAGQPLPFRALHRPDEEGPLSGGGGLYPTKP